MHSSTGTTATHQVFLPNKSLLWTWSCKCDKIPTIQPRTHLLKTKTIKVSTSLSSWTGIPVSTITGSRISVWSLSSSSFLLRKWKKKTKKNCNQPSVRKPRVFTTFGILKLKTGSKIYTLTWLKKMVLLGSGDQNFKAPFQRQS